MWAKYLVILSFITINFIGIINGQVRQFPPNFRFGSASASYQVEGAWNVDGKGPSIWDTLTHIQPSPIADGSTGDDAANSYYMYEEDVRLLRESGMHFYRFSIAWTRIFPDGDVSSINELGLQYYDNLINELIDNGIEPMVTMYHWDMPQRLQDIGGMASKYIVKYFVEYARVLFERYGDRVKIWSTFNEPVIICENGYGSPDRAPLVMAPGVGNYLCAHNLLIAHAEVYHLYQEQFFAQQQGKVGIVLNCGYAFNETDSQLDIDAAERAMQFYCGWYGHPLFIGGYPPVMIEYINRKSTEEGRAWSRLPVMDETLQARILGTTDYVGINYYTSNIVRHQPSTGTTSFDNDQDTASRQDPTWPVAASSWLRSIPAGLTGVLKWFTERYDSPELIITENGWSDDGSDLNDFARIQYLHGHLNAVLDAIADGCNVTGHTTWSILDNFEWMLGYTERFGIYHVDFTNGLYTRTAKSSVAYLRGIIESGEIEQTPPTPLI